MLCSWVIEWHKRFKERCKDVKNNSRYRRPSLSRTEDNGERVMQCLKDYHQRHWECRIWCWMMTRKSSTCWDNFGRKNLFGFDKFFCDFSPVSFLIHLVYQIYFLYQLIIQINFIHVVSDQLLSVFSCSILEHQTNLKMAFISRYIHCKCKQFFLVVN